MIEALDPAPPDVRLEHLVVQDIDRIVEIARAAFESDAVADEVRSMLDLYVQSELVGVPLTEQSAEALPREYFTILMDGEQDRIAGVTGLYRLGTWTWPGNLWLGWTAVAPELQGHGVGSAALAAVMRRARASGAQRLKVETDAGGRAQKFYARNGFVEEARLVAHYGPATDAVVLSRSLL
jgi:GNAT superfamily N-acetyltransferase